MGDHVHPYFRLHHEDSYSDPGLMVFRNKRDPGNLSLISLKFVMQFEITTQANEVSRRLSPGGAFPSVSHPARRLVPNAAPLTAFMTGKSRP
jgi:hypothetical protein